jgi:hypothetical protein
MVLLNDQGEKNEVLKSLHPLQSNSCARKFTSFGINGLQEPSAGFLILAPAGVKDFDSALGKHRLISRKGLPPFRRPQTIAAHSRSTADHARKRLRPRIRRQENFTRRDCFLAEIDNVPPWGKGWNRSIRRSSAPVARRSD